MPFAPAAPTPAFAPLGRRGSASKRATSGCCWLQAGGRCWALHHQCGAPAIHRRNIAGDQGNTMHLGGRPAGAGVEYVVVGRPSRSKQRS